MKNIMSENFQERLISDTHFHKLINLLCINENFKANSIFDQVTLRFKFRQSATIYSES